MYSKKHQVLHYSGLRLTETAIITETFEINVAAFKIFSAQAFSSVSELSFLIKRLLQAVMSLFPQQKFQNWFYFETEMCEKKQWFMSANFIRLRHCLCYRLMPMRNRKSDLRPATQCSLFRIIADRNFQNGRDDGRIQKAMLSVHHGPICKYFCHSNLVFLKNLHSRNQTHSGRGGMRQRKVNNK